MKMKTKLFQSWAAGAVVAMVCLSGGRSGSIANAQDQQPPPPADNVAPDAAAALPPGVYPSSPLAQVIKLTQAGVSEAVIMAYVTNSGSTFNLNPDKIIFMKDIGAPDELVTAMMQRDQVLQAQMAASAYQPPPPSAPPTDTTVPETTDIAPPPTEVTVDYFYDTLAPYGAWVDVEGYGRCWRPTVVIYDSSWRPYCDRGHWVYTDYGWYWDSDYSWGATFHYGRWFRHARYGWCWWPDTVWAPSWVTWRSSSDYCGWAPLPPFTVYRPGFGFFYRGASVAVGFDFGLEAGCFTFVSPDRFCDRHPRYYRAEHERLPEIFHRTTVINNYNVHDRNIVNGGIPVERFNTGGRHIQPVAIAQIPNAGRQGWRGNEAGGNNQLRHGPVLRNEPNNDTHQNRPGQTGAPGIRPPEHGSQPQTPNRNLNETSPVRPQSPAQPGNRPGLLEEGNRILTPPANNNSAPGTPFNRTPQPPPANNSGRGIQPANNVPPVHNQPVQTPPTVSTPANTHPAPATSGNVRNINPAPSVPVNRDQPRNYSGEPERHYTAPATPTAPVHSQPQPQSPTLNSPRNSAPTAPAQSQPRSSGSSDKDRQNH